MSQTLASHLQEERRISFNVFTGLDCPQEKIGGPAVPTLEGLGLGKSVERRIELDRVKVFSIVFQPS